MNKRGHTFVEVIIAVAIIGFLASMGIAVYDSSTEKARKLKDLQQNTQVIIENNFNMICDKPVGERDVDLICTAKVNEKDVDYACTYYYNGDGFTINCY